MKDFEDASLINNLHEAPLLYLLLRRFSEQHIYTNCSDVLISVNPYSQIEGMYTEEIIKKVYNNSTLPKPCLLPPHVYNIANNAYNVMMNGVATRDSKKNQSVIISGESGAGKTEAAKQVMKYLIAASRFKNVEEASSTDVDSIQASLMQSNVILEAFGNAKTLRNDNSSRFGKYIKLRYDDSYTLRGAYTEHFLLEKTRLMQADKGERNYHVFYQLLAGLDEETKAFLYLTSSADFSMLSCGDTLTIPGVDDAAEFSSLTASLSTIGFTDEESSDMYAVLASLLHLGNMKFVGDEDGGRTKLTTESIPTEKLSALLGVEAVALGNAVTVRNVRSGRGSIMSMNLNEAQSKQGVNALIKHIYGSLFAWLIEKINISNANNAHSSSFSSKAFIGILDIFGFEIMKYNSLSQLCINFANEKLQQQFNQQIFVLEKELYEKEGLPIDVITFRDNQPVIDLLEKKPSGIIPLLEEQSLLSRKPNTSQLITSFNKPHDGKHPNYQKARFGNEDFVIKHFAGDVQYSGDALIEKNNDSLHDDLRILITNSTNEFLVNTMTEYKREGKSGYLVSVNDFTLHDDPEADDDEDAASSKTKLAASNTVTSVFRSQLTKLVSTLTSTEPHYIKCIKPNSSKSASTANDELVLEQLRYSGVLEVVRIRREGFPIRLSFSDFHKRFEVLCFKDFPSFRKATPADNEAAAEFICSKCLDPGDFAHGKTKMFMRNGIQEKLSLFVQNIFKSMATKIQARHRTNKKIESFKAVKKSTLKLQVVLRMVQARKRFKIQKKAAVNAQALVRCHQKRAEFMQKRRSAKMIAAVVRGHQASEGYKQTKASIKLQSKLRSQWAQKELKKSKKAQARIACNIRAKQGKKKFDETKEVIVMLQSLERQRYAQNTFKGQKKGALRLQVVYRMVHAIVVFKKQKAAAVKLEAAQRRLKQSREYKRQKKAALVLHNVVRRFTAMAKLEHMKMGLFSGKKRRNNSVVYLSQGDYIKAQEDANLMNWLKEGNVNEDEDPEIVFADVVQKFNRKGKKQERHVVLTRKYCYFMDKNKTKSCYNLAEHDITGGSLSTMADDFVILHLKEDRDLVMTCEHKTEMIMVMAKVVREEMKEDFPLTCADKLAFQTFGGGFSRSNKLQEVDFEFFEDDGISVGEKWKLSVSNGGKLFTVLVAPALVSEAKHPLGVPRSAKFQVMVGGRKKTHAPPVRESESSKKKGFMAGMSSKLLGKSTKGLGRAMSSASTKSTVSTSGDRDSDGSDDDVVVSGVNTFRNESALSK